MTILERVRKGDIPDEVARAAASEGIPPEVLAERIARGTAIVLVRAGIEPLAIGEGCRVKVNANIGTSKDMADPALELKKARAAVEAGADTLMDLSTGGPIDEVRRAIIKGFDVPIGTVPIYQAAIKTIEHRRSLVEMSIDDIFETIELHARDGVSFVTVHCGVTLGALEKLKRHPRILDIVSRGGAFLAEWMEYNEKENPLYDQFDRLLDIARRYELVLSLGDGLRPGSTLDATDPAQLEELYTLGELTKRAQDAGVQVMIEGPGHVPLDQIEANVLLEKQICRGAPFYVLGPLPIDCAPGYDHIATAIGGAIAAMAGADYLCYVTPSEHLALPTID
ncbi:MAG TPA: phosphomethylpyrimidine synthase ThiC, partial [Proteobacteria bacterium]|nr:phosphomethylpyrimidine synthase ThiC [Pseudomonadota bacterium]